MTLTSQQKAELLSKFGNNIPADPTEAETTQSIVESRFNQNKQAVDNQKKSGLFSDLTQAGQDISQSTTKRMGAVGAIGKDLATGKQGLVRSTLQTIGQGAGWASDLIGSAIMGVAKQLTPDVIQKPIGEVVSTGVGKIVQTEPVQKLVNWYSNLDEQKKRDIDAVLGTASLATDVLGGIGAKKVGTEAISMGTDIAKKGITGAKDVAIKSVAEIAPKPENIMQRVARINPLEQSKFQKMTGESVGEFLTNRKIFGSSEDVAQKLVDGFQQSKKSADDALATLKGAYKPKQVEQMVKELLKKEVGVSSPNAVSPDLKRVMAWNKKLKENGLSMPEINEVKRLYERSVKLDYAKQNLPDAVRKANNLDSAVRNWQINKAEELGLKNLPEINKETQAYKTLADALGKKLAGSQANNAITLTDWVILAGGDPTAVGGFIGKKLLSSTKLQGKVAEMLSKGKKTKTVKAEFGKPKNTLESFLKKIESK